MITWRSGIVVSLGRAWSGALELTVEVDESGDVVRALAYPALVGNPDVGDRVILNTAAQTLGLGTGGYALVVAQPDRLPSDPPQGPGHLVKARYTPLQTVVLGVDEQESAHHQALRDADDLGGMPVVVADLHSAVPAVIAGIRGQARREGLPVPNVCYLMTDGGALPAWFSRTIAALREVGWISASITTGQAFGGDHEAVSVHSGLLAARHVLGADITVVAQGPGNLGTGTTWGFSGVSAGEALNAAAVLGGSPVGSLRVSATDPRERHLGISHHSLTSYSRVALAPADIVIPKFTDSRFGWLNVLITAQAAAFSEPSRHTAALREAGPAQLEALRESPVQLSTMGRDLAADPTPFLAAAVAGEHAAGLLTPHA